MTYQLTQNTPGEGVTIQNTPGIGTTWQNTNFVPIASRIEDLAYNPLVPNNTAQMLGWGATHDFNAAAKKTSLGLRIYNFFIESIRHEDAKAGRLLKRYLDGPQAVWEAIEKKIFSASTFWDIENIEDGHLPYLKSVVGWTGQWASIFDQLDAITQRRVIASSISIWKERGTWRALEQLLSLITNNDVYIVDWFDLRWVLGEAELGTETRLLGPSLEAGAWTSNLKVVNDGSLDMNLVAKCVDLMRPVGESVEITELMLKDSFSVDNDTRQWTKVAGDFSVSDGAALLVGELVEDPITGFPFSVGVVGLNAVGAEYWSDYSATFQVGFADSGDIGETFFDSFGFVVYSNADGSNGYWVALTRFGTTFMALLSKLDGGLLEAFVEPPLEPPLAEYESNNIVPDSDGFFNVQVTAITTEHDTEIKVYINNNQAFNVTDNTHRHGKISLVSFGAVSEKRCALEFRDVEIMKLPGSTTIVGPK